MSVNSKDAFYFPHDSNAKDDPKCSLLIEQLGLEGYGAFWVLVETLRDQPGYCYPMALLPVIARKYNTTHDKLRAVVETYGLFRCEDGIFFYSPSLKKRMEKIDNRRKILAESGRKGGLKTSKVKARLKPPLSICSSDPQAEKKSKINNKVNKITHCDCVLLTDTEYQKLIAKFGEPGTKQRIEKLNNYILSKGKKYMSHYATILVWEDKNKQDWVDNQQPEQKKQKQNLLNPYQPNDKNNQKI